MQYDKKYNAIYEVMSEIEGGYSNSAIDLGGETQYGITHTTFDNWNKLKKRPMRDIKTLSQAEAKEILYEMYYKASGADKLEDWRDSLVLFDNAVQYGDVNARRMFKNANNNIYKMIDDRLKIYQRRVDERPDQAGNLAGWKRRMNLIKKGCDMLVEKGYYKPKNADMITPFDEGYDGLLKKIDDATLKESGKTRESAKNEFLYRLDKQGTPTGYASNLPQPSNNSLTDLPFTAQQIGKMSSEEFAKNEAVIMDQLKHGLITNEPKNNFSNYTNPATKTNKIYTREDLDSLSTDEYSKLEPEIMAQLNSIGIPSNSEMQQAQSHGGAVYVNEYTRQDGTKVRGYWRSR